MTETSPSTVRPRHGPGRRHGRWAKPLILIAPLCLTMALSLCSIRQEALVTQFQQRLDRQTERLADPSLGVSDGGENDALNPLPAAAPARVLLADALYLAREAAPRLPDARRRAMIERARYDVRQLLDIRPHWGEAWIVMAYLDSLSSSSFGSAEANAIAHSYLDAPLIPDAGMWRVERGLANFDAFPVAMQSRIVDETVWLIRNKDGPARTALFQMARESDAYRDVFLRWREFAGR